MLVYSFYQWRNCGLGSLSISLKVTRSLSFKITSLFVSLVLAIKPRALNRIGKHSASDQNPAALFWFCFQDKVLLHILNLPWTHYVALAGLKHIVILLPQSLKCWNYRCTLLYPSVSNFCLCIFLLSNFRMSSWSCSYWLIHLVVLK